ncbi:hypothetical protein N8D56_24170 [Devosia sp. A8/3-2]|nr:hypothetical protein N8D56_24170 [Devosia sp. A8/3-2]
MSYNALNEGSVVLRLEFSIADAVHQRGLFAVLQAAIAASVEPAPHRSGNRSARSSAGRCGPASC